ncbi:hypothetical protein [Catelliglobosispora koreensis]|uniref:hypothetical protein n=1 Tax=Catelliglobosispora koreensis TaxID=129052 RepID=UPI00039F1D5A|nr:hypothetical protein [Catelliglobosispora koreensis]
MAAGLAGQSMRTWGAAAGVLALALSGLFGGLDDAKKPPVRPGTEIVMPTWKVTVLSARVIASHPKMFTLSKGNQLLTVTAKVEITADSTWTAGGGRGLRLGDIIRLTGVTGIVNESEVGGLPMTTPAGVLLKRDNNTTLMLHPGLPEEVEFYWEQKPGTAPAKELTIHIQSMLWRGDSFTTYEDWHIDDAKNVEVVVPLDDQRATTQPAAQS